MQKGNLGARESADASLREMLAHLNVIDAGIARIGETSGTEVTGAAGDVLSRLELIAFLAARVHEERADARLRVPRAITHERETDRRSPVDGVVERHRERGALRVAVAVAP